MHVQVLNSIFLYKTVTKYLHLTPINLLLCYISVAHTLAAIKLAICHCLRYILILVVITTHYVNNVNNTDKKQKPMNFDW